MKSRIVDFPIFKDALPEVSGMYDLSLRQVRLAELPKYFVDGQSFCTWCHLGGPLKHHAQRYCSDDCRMSANMWSNPQSYLAKAYILINNQDCACTLCGFCYEHRILKYIETKEKAALEPKSSTPSLYKDIKIHLWGVGYNLSTHHDLEMDHIIPIHKKGQGIGLDNVQAVCRQCHKEKTYQDSRR